MSILTFPQFSRGGTTRSFTVPLICDDVSDILEKFRLSASIFAPSSGNFTPGGNTAVGIIITNEDCPTGNYGSFNISVIGSEKTADFTF